MAKNTCFHFKQFSIQQEHCAMKVSTDACLFGAQTSVENRHRILDIGAGTGLLALMAAQRSGAMIEAVELDTQAAKQAQNNFSNSLWASRLTIHCANIQQFASAGQKQFDLIICNPPFFTSHTGSLDTLRHQARHNNTLSFAELIEVGNALLSPDGYFEVLLPTSEYPGFMGIAEATGFILSHITHIQPKPDKPIHRGMIRLAKQTNGNSHSTTHTESLIGIRDDQGVYSQAFRELLAPYYLKL